MSDLPTFSIRGTARVTVPCLAVLLFALPAMAQHNNSEYIFLLASGVLCDPDDSSSCPAIVKADQGDSYEVSGAGTFDAQDKSVKAAGTFTHKSQNGNVLDTGVWVASEVMSFVSYGAAPGALGDKGLALGFGPFALKRPSFSVGSMPMGGLAVFRIRLLPMRGASRSAVLEVNCALGNVPSDRAVEGIRLTLEENGPTFSEEEGGRVMFLLIPPAVAAPLKTPQQESSETPSN